MKYVGDRRRVGNDVFYKSPGAFSNLPGSSNQWKIQSFQRPIVQHRNRKSFHEMFTMFLTPQTFPAGSVDIIYIYIYIVVIIMMIIYL